MKSSNYEMQMKSRSLFILHCPFRPTGGKTNLGRGVIYNDSEDDVQQYATL